MRLSRLICVILLNLPILGYSQSSYLDSLLQEYHESTIPQDKLTLLRAIAREEPDTDQKIEYGYMLRELADEHNAFFFQHSAELQLGIGYRFKGDLSSSLQHLLTSLEIAEVNHDQKLIGSSYGEISATYASQGDTRTSVQYMNKAILIFQETRDTLNLAIALLNTAYDYYTLDELDTSMLYGMQAEALVSEYSMMNEERRQSLLAYIQGNMGITQAALGEEKQAIEALQNSIETLRSIEDYYAIADFMKFLGEIEFEAGEIEKAEAHALEALELTRRYGLSELNRDLSFLLYRINTTKGNYREALEYHLVFKQLADSIENKSVIRKMEKQSSAFELAQKETEVQLLQAQRKNQQAVIVIATVVVFAFAVLVIVIFIYYRSKIRVNRILRRQKASLERLNETKDKFFSIISHDLRGPVSSLMGVSHLIRHYVEENDVNQLMKMADHMEMTVEQLTTLLDNLLNWAMQQQGHFPNVPEKVNISSMMDEIVGMFSNMAAGKKIEIKCNYDPEIQVWVDRNSVHTIFRNLINNAIKFTEEGGWINAIVSEKEDHAIVVVEDNGIGIPEKDLKKIFSLSGERATYGTAGEKGLGLGLQLVHEFVKMNGGEINVESSQGEGTTFTVKLPLFEKAGEHVAIS